MVSHPTIAVHDLDAGRGWPHHYYRSCRRTYRHGSTSRPPCYPGITERRQWTPSNCIRSRDKALLELLNYLRANGFKTYIVSGGGVEFMRVFSERVYGIPPEQVVGSTGKLQFELRDNQPVLVKLPEVDFVDDKDGKPIGIQKFIGRRPIASFGNSDGDLQMLQWTTSGEGARFALIVHHTDPEREWAYDRASRIGRLDKALDEATAKGWTVLDMKADWKTIFPIGDATP